MKHQGVHDSNLGIQDLCARRTKPAKFGKGIDDLARLAILEQRLGRIFRNVPNLEQAGPTVQETEGAENLAEHQKLSMNGPTVVVLGSPNDQIAAASRASEKDTLFLDREQTCSQMAAWADLESGRSGNRLRSCPFPDLLPEMRLHGIVSRDAMSPLERARVGARQNFQQR